MSRLLWYGESSYAETGAGQVAKHLLPVFKQIFEHIHHVPINQHWDPPALPDYYSVTASNGGDAWNKENARHAITTTGNYDVLFLTGDINIIAEFREAIAYARLQGKKVIAYAAMDTQIYTRSFWDILTMVDIPVVFTYWCKRQLELCVPELRGKAQVIYHGTEPDVFFPLSEDERKLARQEMFGIEGNTFLVLNVNRNQMRKDLPRTIAAFYLFNEQVPHSLLYLHSKQHDLGGDLPACARYFGLRTAPPGANVMFPPRDYNELTGISRVDLNRIYNAADVCVSTSTGEGWGLTTTEAMAAGTPFIGPDNTVFPELLGGENERKVDYTPAARGILVESGGPDLWSIPFGISATPREICSTTGMVGALKYVHDHRDRAKNRAERARAWTLEHMWPQIQAQWLDLFKEIL